MTYRDDAAALRARLDEAEAEIARLKARLEGRSDTAGVRTSALAGGPTSLDLVATVEGELHPDHHERLVEALTGRGLAGQPTVVGRTLMANLASPQTARMVQVTVTPRDGKTVIRVRETFAGLYGGLYGGVVGGAGGGGLGLVVTPILVADPTNWAFALGAAVTWVGAVFGVTRALYGHLAAKRVRDARQLLEALVEATRAALPPARVRVEAAEDEALSEARDGPPRQRAARDRG